MAYDDVGAADFALQDSGDTRGGALSRRLRGALRRIRYQLLGGFLAAVVLPTIIGKFSSADLLSSIQYRNSLIGELGALLFGYLVFRKIAAYPGVRATAYIVPTFVGSYGFAVLFFFLLRIDYSGLQFTASFLLTTAFFYALFYAIRKGQRLSLQLVAVGNAAELRNIRCVDWRVLASPADARPNIPVVVDLRAALTPEWERFIAESVLVGRQVYNAKQVQESLSGRVQVEHLSENTFGSLIPNSIYAAAKRQVDIVAALVALVISAPVMLMVAWAIRIDSPGPAIFRQQRMGLGGNPFTVFKFRTMRCDADNVGVDGAMTRDNDPRITRLGQALRRLRLDELPQAWNILRGDMSWIGPRPEAVALTKLYEKRLPYYNYRHVVRPGLTGWAQVNQGHVTSVEDVNAKLQYDFFYAKNFSLWLDILVFLMTIRVVLTGHGAR